MPGWVTNGLSPATKKIGVTKITPNHFFVAGERLELSTS